ncbi:MAG: methyltransferase domain-containing protein [Bacteriovoracia bacterium]
MNPKQEKPCLVCKAPVSPFISYGQQPIANGFLKPEDFSREYFFEMQVGFCSHCKMVQLMEQPDRERMFNENYAFFSGTSQHMAIHFKEFADHVMKDYLEAKDPFVVEIGSNDGVMLKNFAEKKIRHLGIEPSKNVADVAIGRGINTVSRFFDAETARWIVSQNGQADAFLAANVMCHIGYIHSVLEGIDVLLRPDGTVMFEDPYLGDVIQKTSYDQIYDEHVFLYSVASVGHMFGQYGMEIVDVEPQTTHGGSMRYVIKRKGVQAVSERVREQVEFEKKLGLDKAETYERFRENCETSKRELRQLLVDLKQQGKRVVGYAATSKSTTVINYCNLTPDLIEFIGDSTPIKQGKFSPGKHIPILASEKFREQYPDYGLLFGWNHFKEITAKEQDFRESGGKWIVYVPKVQVITA